jgi:outer membrane protein, adhesin transport system
MQFVQIMLDMVKSLRASAFVCAVAIFSYSQSSYGQIDLSQDDEFTKLSQLVELAITTHPSAQAKLAEIAGSVAGVDAAKWQYYPSLSVQAERNTTQASNSLSSAETSSIRVQQTLWAGGRLVAGTESAEFRRQAAQNALFETRNTIALRTLEAWQGWKTSLGRERAALLLIEQLDRLSGMMQRRVEQQVSPPIELQQLKIRVSQAKAELLTARSSQEIARQRILQWAGSDSLQLLAAPSKIKDKPLSGIDSRQNSLISSSHDTAMKLELAAKRASALLRSDAEIQAMRSDVKQKRAEQWPSVYARLDRQFNSGGLFSRKPENTVFVGLQYTLGAGLSLRSQIETAESKVLSQQNEREALQRQILETYRAEWREYQTTLERITLAMEVTGSNSAVIESYTRLFVAGRRSWLELLNALREANAADQLLSDLLAQQQASHFRLRVYLGELSWQTVVAP